MSFLSKYTPIPHILVLNLYLNLYVRVSKEPYSEKKTRPMLMKLSPMASQLSTVRIRDLAHLHIWMMSRPPYWTLKQKHSHGMRFA